MFSVDKNNVKNGAHYILSRRYLLSGIMKKKFKVTSVSKNAPKPFRFLDKYTEDNSYFYGYTEEQKRKDSSGIKNIYNCFPKIT